MSVSVSVCLCLCVCVWVCLSVCVNVYVVMCVLNVKKVVNWPRRVSLFSFCFDMLHLMK